MAGMILGRFFHSKLAGGNNYEQTNLFYASGETFDRNVQISTSIVSVWYVCPPSCSWFLCCDNFFTRQNRNLKPLLISYHMVWCSAKIPPKKIGTKTTLDGSSGN